MGSAEFTLLDNQTPHRHRLATLQENQALTHTMNPHHIKLDRIDKSRKLNLNPYERSLNTRRTRHTSVLELVLGAILLALCAWAWLAA